MRHLISFASVLTLSATLLATSSIAAQEMSPAASPAPLPASLTAWAAAWASGDPTQIAATYTGDAVFEEVPLGVTTHGQDELSSYLQGLKSAFPDFSLVVTDGFVTDDRAAAQWVVTGTYTGQFPGLPPGTGQHFSLRGASVLELKHGKVRDDREYWDAYAFLIALGVLPAPSQAATPEVSS
jgi:steroid delta-isomerase-like uncharacterized protein